MQSQQRQDWLLLLKYQNHIHVKQYNQSYQGLGSYMHIRCSVSGLTRRQQHQVITVRQEGHTHPDTSGPMSIPNVQLIAATE